MFTQLYYKLIFQDFSNIQQKYQKIIVYELSSYKKFYNCLTYGIDINKQKDMIESMLQYYGQNSVDAIKSMLTWKSFVLKQQQLILIDYQVQPQYDDGSQVIRFIFYEVKSQKLVYKIYRIQYKSKAIFDSMVKRNDNKVKIFNTVKKYGYSLN